MSDAPRGPTFSRRVPGDLRPNALARERARRGRIPFDLTESNPTRCGIFYPTGLLDALADDDGLIYRPAPCGLASARQAVAADYHRHGVEVDPDRIVLTASTSEAYSFLFRLLCDPGDTVLIPAPSYPLFEHLAALDGVRPLVYRLDPEHGWQPDVASLGAGEPRAVVAVHPNNPTGSLIERAAARGMVRQCAERAVSLIVDEVFLDYPLTVERAPASFAATRAALTFTLGGLSKSVGLPQLKLAWIVVGGPETDVTRALARLEFIADQALSVGTPVQLALPRLLEDGIAVRHAILERCRTNLAALHDALSGSPAMQLVEPRGGWSAVLRYPDVVDEETLVLELLDRDGVGVHPGYFFDFARPGFLVLSLLPEPGVFREGLDRLLRRIETRLEG